MQIWILYKLTDIYHGKSHWQILSMETDISQAQILRLYFESYCVQDSKYRKTIGACSISILLFKIKICIGLGHRWKINIQNICLAHMEHPNSLYAYVQGKYFEYLFSICAQDLCISLF